MFYSNALQSYLHIMVPHYLLNFCYFTGIYGGNPRKFWLRLTKVKDVVCVKYSTDKANWILLRLCQFSSSEVLVGLMCCSPQREGLKVVFSEVEFSTPPEDILHSN